MHILIIGFSLLFENINFWWNLFYIWTFFKYRPGFKRCCVMTEKVKTIFWISDISRYIKNIQKQCIKSVVLKLIADSGAFICLFDWCQYLWNTENGYFYIGGWHWEIWVRIRSRWLTNKDEKEDYLLPAIIPQCGIHIFLVAPMISNKESFGSIHFLCNNPP